MIDALRPPQGIRAMREDDAAALAGVIFDVDDTLTRDGVLEWEAFAALHRLKDAGLSLVAVTGRPLGWADVFAVTWPVDCAIGENGAGWAWREGRRLRVGYFDDEPTRADQRILLDRVRARVAQELPNIAESTDSVVRRCDLAFDIGESVLLDRPTVQALERIIAHEGARVSTSTVHCHAVPGRWDKAQGAVRALGAVLGQDAHRVKREWLFVGDSGNDVEAFEFFEHSAGPANVMDHSLRALPRWIAQADRGLGFAEIADVLVARRGG